MRYSSSTVYDINLGLQHCSIKYKSRVLYSKLLTSRGGYYQYFAEKAIEDQDFVNKYMGDEIFKEAAKNAETLKLFSNPGAYLSELELHEFVDSYHNLEYFLYDCYYYFLCTYPKFIWLIEEDRKFDLNYDLVFQSKDWSDLRHHVIDYLVNKSGRESIRKQLLFLSKFKIKSNLTSIQITKLSAYSLCRNTLIHQEGIICKKLLSDFQNIGFANPFEKDKHIFKDYREFWKSEKYEDIINDVIELITTDIINDKNRLNAWHESL